MSSDILDAIMIGSWGGYLYSLTNFDLQCTFDGTIQD